ncbi:MAG: aminotransferase class V-fold PLP-dependent enzyme [Myxococcales bacterium]|nr:aminotransferase class V-fold PLP-dependent enzyme [Myxococcales bacterium]
MPTETGFDQFATSFLGLGQKDRVQAGGSERRVYLDTTATALMPEVVWRGLEDYFQVACANSHTEAHRAGRDTTRAIEDSRDAIGRLVGYQPGRDVVLFTANGATGAANFLARALFPSELRSVLKRFPAGPPPELLRALGAGLSDSGRAVLDEMVARPLVVVTMMEHHSNLIPWMEAVGHHNLRAARVDPLTGALDLADLQRILEQEGPRVRLVAVTGVSNVTGIVNPVHQIARQAHAVGAQILVDGAQWVPHARVEMHSADPAASLDYLVLSGHKLYAPGSRGALIGSLETLSGRRCVTDVGGGMVEYVTMQDFELKDDVTAREEAGTPNIPGSIAMGLVAEALLRIGMDVVAEREHRLTEKLVRRLERVPGVRIYGSTDLERVPRAGVVSFNLEGIYHGLCAAYLNDFHNIAVRDGCFCAHPYVKALLQIDDQTEASYRQEMLCGDRRNVPGMVRASLGVYSTEDDVEALGTALEQLSKDAAAISARYLVGFDGTYRLGDAPPLPGNFSVADEVERWLGAKAPARPSGSDAVAKA